MSPKNDQDERLIGVIDAGTRTVQFCVFRTSHTKEIAKHTIDITTAVPQEGWSEQDPKEILNAVKSCMEIVVNGLGADCKSLLSFSLLILCVI